MHQDSTNSHIITHQMKLSSLYTRERSSSGTLSNLEEALAPKKRVFIIYTGGNMGKLASEEGVLTTQSGYLSERIMSMPEISSPDMPLIDFLEYDHLVDSSLIGPADWIKIASDIEERYYQYNGFVVLMGTDTMAYAASALSFMLENLGKSVVFTGSQIPFSAVYNDARRNLVMSILFAVSTDFPEVCICFNDKIMRANRTVKVNSVSLDAFDSPNFPPLVLIGSKMKENRELSLPPPKAMFKVHKSLEAKVIVIKLVPGFDDSGIALLIEHSVKLRAIVLELYGTGHGPAKRQSLLDALDKALEKGIVVVALSQCLAGGISEGSSYSLGSEFSSRGVVSGGDMTTECCTTKLAYLFGRYNDPNVVAQLIPENIRGEISAPVDEDTRYFPFRH